MQTQYVTAAPLIPGTEGNDYLVGTANEETINALGGNDIVIGNGDADRLYAGDGNDIVFTLGLTDRYIGYNKSDYTPWDYAFVHGGLGNDVIYTLGEAEGEEGNDLIFAYAPEFGMYYNISGGPGDDLIVLNGSKGYAGPGLDTIIIRGSGVANFYIDSSSVPDDDIDRIIINGTLTGDSAIRGFGPNDIIEFNGVPGINSIEDLTGRIVSVNSGFDIYVGNHILHVDDSWWPDGATLSNIVFNETNINGLIDTYLSGVLVPPASLSHDEVISIARLYNAGFGRDFDAAGLNFWIDAVENGGTDKSVMAEAFLDSSEFDAKFGDDDMLPNAEFVEALYTNVLGRTPEQAGLQFWIKAVDAGMSHGAALIAFSESSENILNTSNLETIKEVSPGFWDLV